MLENVEKNIFSRNIFTKSLYIFILYLISPVNELNTVWEYHMNQQLIKAVNKKKIYTWIAKEEGISRAYLAKCLGLSKTTVSVLVDELLEEEYIVDEGAVEQNKQGRRPNRLLLQTKKNGFLIVNIKKYSIQIAYVSGAYAVEIIKEFPREDLQMALLPLLEECLEEYAKQRILGICIVIPGMIDREKESLVSTVLSMEEDFSIIRHLRANIPKKYPLAIFNDTACLAYAELEFTDIVAANYIYVNINEGVGACLVQDRRMLRGASGQGIQFGHFSIDRKGVPCACGNRGCLENSIGEMVLNEKVRRHGMDTALLPKKIQFRHIHHLASTGVQEARDLIYEIADDLAFALGNLISIFHPEIIVIGGSGRKLGDICLEQLKTSLQNRGFQKFVKETTIKYTDLREEALFLGAAKYYIDTYFDFLGDMSGTLFLG